MLIFKLNMQIRINKEHVSLKILHNKVICVTAIKTLKNQYCIAVPNFKELHYYLHMVMWSQLKSEF